MKRRCGSRTRGARHGRAPRLSRTSACHLSRNPSAPLSVATQEPHARTRAAGAPFGRVLVRRWCRGRVVVRGGRGRRGEKVFTQSTVGAALRRRVCRGLRPARGVVRRLSISSLSARAIRSAAGWPGTSSAKPVLIAAGRRAARSAVAITLKRWRASSKVMLDIAQRNGVRAGCRAAAEGPRSDG
jgi:hypothetical protein